MKAVVGRRGIVQVGEEGQMAYAVYGAVMAVLVIVGLFLAAGAKDTAIHLTGFALVLFGLVNIFAMIHKLTEPPRRES